MEEKMDWFPMYWQKFIIGTLKMNAEEIGAYILLLIHEWDNGFVPEDPQEIKVISKVSYKKLGKVLQKFEKIDGKLYNNPLEIIRIEQIEKNEKNSNRGSKGAKARWDKHRESIAQGMLKQCLGDSKRKEEKREEKNRKEEKREEAIAPELNFNYMIAGKEILSVEETFKENYPVLLTDLKIKHGELKIKKWIQEFSELHKQKSWKDNQDFRHHISSFIKLKSEKENERTQKFNTNPVKTGGGPGKF